MLKFDPNSMALLSVTSTPGTKAASQLLWYRGYLYVAANGDLDKWDVSTMTRVATLPASTFSGTNVQTALWLAVTQDESSMSAHS